MAEADAPAQRTRDEETAETISTFARFLLREEPDLFDNIFRAKRFLELADRRFRGSFGIQESFFDPCTKGGDESCWALGLHQRWNAVLNPESVEMIALHEGTFSFETFGDAPNLHTLLDPNDAFSVCICLWMLRHHRCISRVSLDVSVIAPHYPRIFWRLLRFNAEYLDQVELKGLGESNDDFNIGHLLHSAVHLSHLFLTNFRLTDTGAAHISDIVANNDDLAVLVLRDVRLGTPEIQHLGRIISANGHPWTLELAGSIEPSGGRDDAVANLLDTALGGLRLGISCNWTPFFQRLGNNSELCELEIIDCGALHLSLADLASALMVNNSLKRLKLQLRLSSAEPSIVIAWQRLSQAIGQNRALQLLSFAFSKFGDQEDAAVTALGDALAENETLRELSVEGCELSYASLHVLLDNLARNMMLQKLLIGALEDADMCEQVLGHIVELGLSERVDWICKLKCDRLLWAAVEVRVEAARHGAQVLRKVSVLGPRVQGAGDSFTGLSLMYRALTSLSIEGNVVISNAGAETLEDLFARSSVLESVTLLFPVGESLVVTILAGLASSKTVSSVVVGGGWPLVGAASVAFEKLLETNSSIVELSIVERTRVGFEDLKCRLQRGLRRNYSVSKLRLLYGEERVESRDSRVVRLLQCNRIMTSWSSDAIVGCHMTRGAAYSIHRINTCDSGRLILRTGTGYSDEELDKKLPDALKKAKEILRNMETSLGFKRQPETTASEGQDADIHMDFLRLFFEELFGPLCRLHTFTLQAGE
ncbi:uncharacterized protein LOC144144548 isoform X1 [Haemaphysalis longicornis]